MFRITITAVAVFGAVSSIQADDTDLFTEFRPKAVFEDSRNTSPDSGQSTLRITSAEQLRDVMKTGGFEAEVSDVREVSTQKTLDPWTFPVTAVLSEDESVVTVRMGLTVIKDITSELPADRLLQMMEFSRNNAGILMTYNADAKRTEISVTLPNRNLTGSQLRDQINRTAILARNSANIWRNSDSSPETGSAVRQQQTGMQDLTGTWTAAKSDKEAFAVEFTADGKFRLVYVADGRQTKSAGTFTATEESLELTGADGFRLQGKLKKTSDTEFRFELQNAAVLVFTKAG